MTPTDIEKLKELAENGFGMTPGERELIRSSVAALEAAQADLKTTHSQWGLTARLYDELKERSLAKDAEIERLREQERTLVDMAFDQKTRAETAEAALKEAREETARLKEQLFASRLEHMAALDDADALQDSGEQP